MKCPVCGDPGTRVVDSRAAKEDAEIRRRGHAGTRFQINGQHTDHSQEDSKRKHVGDQGEQADS